ncbi:MAG: hypothetical protein SPF20_10495 [Prevotella sp.]|nr:hypothetical protein [Prevotella sp.]
MKKLLRYSLSVIFAFVASVGFAQTTFDFDNDYKTLFPDLPGVSTTDSHDGDFNKATTCTVDGIAVTVSAKEEGNPNDNRIWTSSPRLRMYSGTFTIQAPEGKQISKIEIAQKKWNANTKVDNGTLDNKGNWTGSANKVVYSIAGNTQIKTMTVTLGEGGTPQPPVEITYTDVASVKDLLANYTEDTKNLNLTLTNAKVTYVNEYNGTINTYVREGDAAIELRTLGFNMPVNSILTGKVKVDLTFYYGVPYLVANAGTNDESITVTESTEAAQPIEATVADIIANKYLNDLVTIKGFTFSKEEYQEGRFNYYANDGEQKIMIYDKFNKVGGVAELTEGEKYNVVGLYGAIFKGTPEIIPTQAVVPTSTGISNITVTTADNAPAYNLAGQKVNAAYKGIVIKNGKKMIKK